jgi:hypothetical protein
MGGKAATGVRGGTKKTASLANLSQKQHGGCGTRRNRQVPARYREEFNEDEDDATDVGDLLGAPIEGGLEAAEGGGGKDLLGESVQVEGGGEEEVAHDLLGASVDFCAMLAEEEQDWGDEEEETSDPDDECGDGSEDGEEDD